MDNLIQQLKDNEKPFGLMSEEMQKKAVSIDKEGMFIVYHEKCRWVERTHVLLYPDCTYRLRPDYEDEPEIVECEIRTNKNETLVYDRYGEWPITGVFQDPDFIGFKFKDGTVMGLPVKYSVPGITSHGYYATYEDLKTGQALEHHAISVLSRRKKQE